MTHERQQSQLSLPRHSLLGSHRGEREELMEGLGRGGHVLLLAYVQDKTLFFYIHNFLFTSQSYIRGQVLFPSIVILTLLLINNPVLLIRAKDKNCILQF
jgi:hypothetical protein